MLPKKRDAMKTGWGVLITAGALGLGLFMGSAGPSRAQDKQAAPSQPQAKDTKEFNEASAAQKETDPNKRLQELDQWKKDYADTQLTEARNTMYLITYVQLKMARQAFDMAQEILKSKPLDLTALADAIQEVMEIKPAPTAVDLDAGEKIAMTLLDNPAVFAPANKPPGQTDQQFATLHNNVHNFTLKVLLAIYVQRDKSDNKRAIDDLTRLINRQPDMYTAAFQLGSSLRAQIEATKRPQDQPPMFWQYARAVDGTGGFALPDATKKATLDFLTKAYTTYHGSADGLQDLLMQAKSAPFPPAGWTLKSNVDILQAQAAADAAARAADPLGTLWREDIKGNLLKNGQSFFDANIKSAELPGPDPNDHSDKPAPRYFNATIVSMTPATRPKELLVGIEKPDVADAKLVFETPLPGKMEPGDKIRFKGVASDYSMDPFMITFMVDEKEDMDGSWTGKNVGARGPTRGGGRGTGATKGGGAKKQ